MSVEFDKNDLDNSLKMFEVNVLCLCAVRDS